jgi:hypothetical protein
METLVAIAILTIPVSFTVALVIFLRVLQRTEATADRIEASALRSETSGKVVAADLAATAKDLRHAAAQRSMIGEALTRMEAADGVVAENLASSVSRADATEGPEGAAADAALRTGDSPSAIHERQDAAKNQNL